jgi:hypothetical protein
VGPDGGGAGAIDASSIGSGAIDAGPSPASQACLDMADAIARAAVRCNDGTYQIEHDCFIQAVVTPPVACSSTQPCPDGTCGSRGFCPPASPCTGSCDSVQKVRDEASLRSQCLPSLDTISCADFAAAKLDPSCLSQLCTDPSQC